VHRAHADKEGGGCVNKPVSNCCGAPVRVEGDVTMYHVCEKCEQACDVKWSQSLSTMLKSATLSLTIASLSSLWCHAAQVTLGTQMAAPVVAAAPMFAPMLSVVAPLTPKTNLFYNIGLTWDAVPHALTTGYRIRYGTNVTQMTNAVTTTNTFCTVSNLAFKPTWYFQAATLYGTNQSEWSYAVQVQPPLEAVFTLSAVFPLYTSSDAVNWITNKVVTLVQTNPPGMTFFRSHLRQLDYQWTNNQLVLKPFSIP
jgi:hypothetical protein